MDGDGEITTEELRQAMIKLMGEHMARSEIDTIVKEADDNGDGTVDFEGQLTSWQGLGTALIECIIPKGTFSLLLFWSESSFNLIEFELNFNL